MTNESRPSFYNTHKNSKWIKDLNVRSEAIKIVEENIGSRAQTLLTEIFYQIYLPRQGNQKKKYMDIKLKSYCRAKEIINEIKRQPTAQENIFTDTPDKEGINI